MYGNEVSKYFKVYMIFFFKNLYYKSVGLIIYFYLY